MPVTNLSLMYRPMRTGLVIEYDSLADFARACSLNTLLWGGYHNPIIPVGPSTALANLLLACFKVDALIPVSDGEAVNHFLMRNETRYPRGLERGTFFQPDWRTKKNRLIFLDAINVVDDLWETTFKYQKAGEHSECCLVHWDPEDPLHAVLGAMFGSYPNDSGLDVDYTAAFRNGLYSQDVPVDPADGLPFVLLHGCSPIQLTMHKLRYEGPRVRDRSGVVVGRSDSFDDLLAFWNLRAAGNNVVFLPVDQPHRCEEYARRHIAHLDTLPDVHPAIMNHVTVTHTGEEAYALEFIRDLPAGKPCALARYDDVVWNGLNEKPLRCFFDHRTALGTVANETERPRVHFTLPEKTFLRDTSGRARYQKLALSVDPYTESVYHGHTLRLPFIPELNDKWGNELVIDSARFRVEPEGCCIIIDADQQTQSLAPASFDRVIDAVFGYAGMKVQKSQAGLLATRVLEAMGGIEACRVFQIGSVRKLIKGLDRASVTQRGEATKIIHDEGRFSRHRRLYIESREGGDLTTDAVFDFLLKKDVFRAGLELSCEHCQLEDWLPLRRIDDFWICEYCGHRNRTSLHLRHRGDWSFRKSGLFTPDNNQEGAIPVLLSLLTCHRIFDEDDINFTTSLKVEGVGKRAEIDFCLIHLEDSGEFQLVIGEAKSDGGEIDSDDIANAISIRAQFASKNIDCCLMFSKTADHFQERELNLFQEIDRQGIPLVLLTSNELESYYPYVGNDIEDRVPYKHAVTLDQVVQNSKALYLSG